MGIESALERMVKLARSMNYASEQLSAVGMADEPYFTVYGDVIDIIYDLLGENTDSIDASVTWHTVRKLSLDTKEAAEVLASEYKRNNGPFTASNEHTAQIIRECARQRKIAPEGLINTILSEWALRYELSTQTA